MASRGVEDEKFVHVFAGLLCRKGLRLPALILLDAGRPLSFLFAQLLWIAQPLVDFLLPDIEIGKVAQLMEDSVAIDQLIFVLEADGLE